MDAAFVDIGLEKNAFLYAGDAVIREEFKEESDSEPGLKPTIGEILKIGQEVLVQVIKDAIGTKGPRVTVNITLPGRFIVLVPNVSYIGISRRIENEEERERLRSVIGRVLPEGFGAIIRTAAEGVTQNEFSEDIKVLTKVWEKINTCSSTSAAPKIIHKDLGLIYKTVRDMFTQSTDKFIINDAELYDKVLEWTDMISPDLKSRVEYYNKTNNIFEFYQIQSKISRALSRKVWLKSGGYIIIDQTEALTAIDVNTGKYVGNHDLEDTILKTNLEAAKEIAKQIRLRDIGGIIIIDFIDMITLDHQQEVLDELNIWLKKDRTKTHVVGISQIGLVEMTRKKIRQNLSSILQTECACCNGTGKVLLPKVIAKDIEREIHRMFNEQMASGIILEAHPVVVKELERLYGENLLELKQKYNKSIITRTKLAQNIEDFEVKNVDNIRYLC
jgi:ribonuclease G